MGRHPQGCRPWRFRPFPRTPWGEVLAVLPPVSRTAGGGLDNAASGERVASGLIFGAGAGVSRRVTDGAGRLRAEVRYDQQIEGKSRGSIVVPKGGSLQIKLGFDLWVR